MDQVSRQAVRRLDRLLVAVPLREEHLARLRAAFPDLVIGVVDGPPAATELAAADALVAWQLDADRLAAAPRLGWLQTGGAGVEGLPLGQLAARGIVVTNMSGVHAPNMAEHILAMMLALARQIPQLVRAQAARTWRDTETHDRVFELQGQTLLLVGLGDIALAVAARAAAFGMRVHGVRRRPDLPHPAAVEEVVPVARLAEVLPRADHVAITLPLTPDTRGLFGMAELAAMRRGAYLYNVGRGAVVDTAALVAALDAGHLGGAGLDVVDPEPLPPDSPLWAMENVLITAHTSGATPRYWDRGVEIIAVNIARYRAGEPLINEVDLVAGY